MNNQRSNIFEGDFARLHQKNDDNMPTEYGGGDGGGGMLEKLEKRVGALETDVSQIRVDLAKLTTRSEVFATKSDIESLRFATKSDIEGLRFSTKSDIESLRTEHQTLRADLVTKVAESERRTLDKIEAASLRHTNELNSFKSTLLFKIGLPVVVTIIAGFGTVITLLIRLLAKSAGLAA